MDSAETVAAKKELRARFLQQRKALDPSTRTHIDAALATRIQALDEWIQATHVCSYLSFGSEVDTRSLIHAAWDAGKTVLLPRCIPNSRTMAWYCVDSFDGLIQSSFGVDEPADDPAKRIDLAALESPATIIALVPGFSFNADGYRLGYGGGFYDTLLNSFKGVSIGLCRDAFFDAAPLVLGEYDLPVSIVATESRTIRIV